MNTKGISNRSVNLQKYFEIHEQKTGESRQFLSAKFGWSPSFFGKLLSGEKNLSDENLIRIANYFDIPPIYIDKEFVQQVRGLFPIYTTTSGAAPPRDNKLFRPTDNVDARKIIWNDRLVPVKRDSRVIGYLFPNSTLICYDANYTGYRADPFFPSTDEPLYLILYKELTKKPQAFVQKTIPSVAKADVFRVITIGLT